ncbi:MAG TPA: DUF1801 domain-containing protein [Propionicimonas sp.]|nr:DUF1801 domain-containing protein [Propionicimonas sp.]
MERTAEDVDGFIASCAEPEAMSQLDAVVVAAMPGASRTLWRGVFWGGTEQAIIGYGDYTQLRPRGQKVEWFLIGLALQKRHFSLYVNATVDGRYLSQVYGPRLGKVKVGASALTFTSPEDLDQDVLVEMLTEVASHRPS